MRAALLRGAAMTMVAFGLAEVGEWWFLDGGPGAGALGFAYLFAGALVDAAAIAARRS